MSPLTIRLPSKRRFLLLTLPLTLPFSVLGLGDAAGKTTSEQNSLPSGAGGRNPVRRCGPLPPRPPQDGRLLRTPSARRLGGQGCAGAASDRTGRRRLLASGNLDSLSREGYTPSTRQALTSY